MRHGLVIAVVLISGCAAGLQRNVADPITYPSLDSRRDLGSECKSSGECPATTTCVRGRCASNGPLVSPQPAAKSSRQRPCERDTDCDSGQLCIVRICESRDLVHQ
jgi:hypothetical protein